MKITLKPIDEYKVEVRDMARGEVFIPEDRNGFYMRVSEFPNIQPGYLPAVDLESGKLTCFRGDVRVMPLVLDEIRARRVSRDENAKDAAIERTGTSS